MSAARSSGNIPVQIPQKIWEKIAVFGFGVVFVTAILVMAIAFPQPTSFQYEVFRIVLAIACGGVAAIIPGFLAVSMDAKGLVIRAGGALAVFLLVYFFSPARLVTSTSPLVFQSNITVTEHSITAGGDITATAPLGGTAIIAAGNVIIDVKEIVEPLLKAHERELSGFREREQAYQDQVKALTDAVTALTQQQGPGIADAVAQLRQRNTEAAETIFQDILTRKATEGTAANQQAAEAARHLGALAFLHNTEKALNAYRQAVNLDPENAEGWIQLGHLLLRKGELDKAADAYRKVLTLGEKTNNRDFLAVAYGNLGNVYLTQDNLDQAEAMYHKVLKTLGDTARNRGHLASTYGNLGLISLIYGDLGQAETRLREALKLYKALGNKEGMARQHVNLGNVYWTQGNPDQAEAKYREALVLTKDNKEIMARACGNLGTVHLARGHLDRAEAKYRKALDLNEAVGSKKGIAVQHRNLGNVALDRGDLNQAEARYDKSLKLHKEGGSKIGVAEAYGSLGNVYQMRGNLGQAKAMYHKALTLFQEIRAAPQVEQIQKLLRALDAQSSH